MEIERPHPHRTTSAPTTTSELFICFTSHFSKSSSMRLSSKSILSPAHHTTTDTKSTIPTTLSTSLSRRLRHNGSLRGGAQSPAMFPSTQKNKGSSSGFQDNPEPSSPKVTCIGQVRVKTKKQGKKMKMRACRSKSKRFSGGEASFRRIENTNHEGGMTNSNNNQCAPTQQDCELNHRNQRWVHLPLTICEALRGFGAEFSCLFPCKSSCFSSGGGFCKKTGEESQNSSSCAVFRWLVSLQEGEEDGGKRRDIELVVGGEEERESSERVMERECSRRRSIFDDMEFDDLFVGNNDVMKNDSGEIDGEEEGGRRVSVCVPPKNALLLMRCRSDPLKIASLSRKLWDPPLPQDDDEDEGEIEQDKRENEDLKVDIEEKTEVKEEKTEVMEEKTEEICEERVKIDEMLEDCVVVESKIEALSDFVKEEEQKTEEETEEKTEEKAEEETEEKTEEITKEETEEKQSIENRGFSSEEQGIEVVEETEVIEDENLANVTSIEEITVEEKVEDGETEQDLVTKTKQNEEMKEEEKENEEKSSDLLSELILEKKDSTVKEESSDISTSTSSSSSSNSSEESTAESKERENEQEEEEEQNPVVETRKSMEEKENSSKQPTSLPDCLLLMMCEPKLSMEVSKETWVCSTDFIRWLPDRHHKKPNKTDGSDESTKKKTKPAPVQPPAQPPVQPGRSSISFPAGGGSVANLIEQKLVQAGKYEPFVLTRCKSAPMRSTAKIAAPEMACSLWGRENGRRNKLEPHRPATCGVGAAGVGF